MNIGDHAPHFHLPDTAGTEHTNPHGTPVVVVFTCNHCPYALAWHDRLMAVGRDYGDRAQFLAINANDAQRYPGDGYEAMQERVAAEDWSMPYLHDATQEVARAYGAKTTPDVFVIDGHGSLRYRGALDADHGDPALDAAYLREALDAVLDGREPARPETAPVGCSVKWKP